MTRHSLPPYDQKLKDAAAEIMAVVRKYDVGAYIALTSPKHSEFVFHLPTWSGVQPEEQSDGSLALRIRIKKEQQELAEATTWLVAGTMELLERGLRQYGHVLDLLRTKALIMLPSADREPYTGGPKA